MPLKITNVSNPEKVSQINRKNVAFPRICPITHIFFPAAGR